MRRPGMSNDKQITDHYAIIPTGQGLGALKRPEFQRRTSVYETIVRRFLSIFYPPAVYQKISLTVCADGRVPSSPAAEVLLKEPGYLEVMAGFLAAKKRQQDR